VDSLLLLHPSRHATGVSLAQMRGTMLTTAACAGAQGGAPLSDARWRQVEARFEARCRAGGSAGDGADLEGHCAICLSAWGLRAQSLLSCGHAFHAACIAGFERCVGWEHRSCPLCRGAGYERRAVRTGARLHVLRCAVSVQCAVRRHLARAELWRRKKAHYLRGPVEGAVGDGDHALPPQPQPQSSRVAAFTAQRLRELGRDLERADAARSRGQQSALRGLDDALAQSRRILDAAQARIDRRQAASAPAAAPDPSAGPSAAATDPSALLSLYADRLVALEAQRLRAAEVAEARRTAARAAREALAAAAQRDRAEESRALQADWVRARSLGDGDWAAVAETALARVGLAAVSSAVGIGAARSEQAMVRAGVARIATPASDITTGQADDSGRECLVCMEPLFALSDAHPADSAALLSCSHLFHAQCIASLEYFMNPILPNQNAAAASGEETAAPTFPRCPVCRQGYCRRSLEVHLD
jgi:hypothetical protein